MKKIIISANDCIYGGFPILLEAANEYDVNGNPVTLDSNAPFVDKIQIPACTYVNLYGADGQSLIDNLRLHFDMFNIDFEIAQGSSATQVIVVDRYWPDDEWPYGPEYDNFKRLMWSAMANPNGTRTQFAGMCFNCNPDAGFNKVMLVLWDPSDQNSKVFAHEIGHYFSLSHLGHGIEEYHKCNNSNWSPIMGEGRCRWDHWSDGRYERALKQDENQDDILDMHQYGGLQFKKGLNTDDLSDLVRNKGFKNFPWESNQYPFRKKDHKWARWVRRGNPPWKGLIGHPYDYDIIKILLPKGTYGITATRKRSPNDSFYLTAEKMYCNFERDKYEEQYQTNDRFYGDVLTDSIDSDPGYNHLEEVFTRIGVLNDIKYRKEQFKVMQNEAAVASESFTLDYTTLIYVRVCGNYKGPVDPSTERPTQTFMGFSRYGSMGKYYLDISGGMPLIEDNILEVPNGVPAKFYVCVDGQLKTTFLFFRDDQDKVRCAYPCGDPNSVHTLKHVLIKDGEAEIKEFLVYGKSIDVDTSAGNTAPSAPIGDGKFYLYGMSQFGKSIKKEFIVGEGLDEDEDGGPWWWPF